MQFFQRYLLLMLERLVVGVANNFASVFLTLFHDGQLVLKEMVASIVSLKIFFFFVKVNYLSPRNFLMRLRWKHQREEGTGKKSAKV